MLAWLHPCVLCSRVAAVLPATGAAVSCEVASVSLLYQAGYFALLELHSTVHASIRKSNQNVHVPCKPALPGIRSMRAAPATGCSGVHCVQVADAQRPHYAGSSDHAHKHPALAL